MSKIGGNMKLRNKKTGEEVYVDGRTIDLDKLGIKKFEDLVDYEEVGVFFIDTLGEAIKLECVNKKAEDEAETRLTEIGNLFLTKEEAEKAVDKLKAITRLKDKGFRFVEWQQHGITEDGVMDGVVYFENAKNVNRSDLDLLFGGEE